MSNSHRAARLGVAGVVLSAAASLSQAENFALEEVIVTAQKKAESLQDTPISLTAFGEDALEKQGIGSLSDIGSKVPALTIEPFPINNATLRIFIRGIGINDAQVTQDPPVGIYIDGAYVARSTGTALDVAELQRMEILRGPQGTLYGRNTTGGAINLITKRPNVDAVEFKQKFTFGDRNLFTSKTTLNVPVMDTMAVKLSYLNTRSDGYIDNGGPGGDWGDREVEGMRLDLRWDISDSITLDYAYDQSDMEFYNMSYQAERPPTPRGSMVDLIMGELEPKVENGPGYTSKRLDRLDSFTPLEASETEISGHSLTVNLELGETTELKYILAYRELYDAAYADLAGGSADAEFGIHSYAYTAPDGNSYPTVVPVVQQDQLSHELQFSGDLFEGSVNYILGAYYFQEDASENNNPIHHQFSAPVDGAEVTERLTGPVLGPLLAPLGAAVIDSLDMTISNLIGQEYEIENEAWAVFGQATWTPNIWDERLHLTFGARHSEDRRFASKQIDDRSFFYIGSLGGYRIEATPDAGNCTGGSFDQNTACVLTSAIVAGLGIPDPHKVYSTSAERKFKDDSFNFVAEFDINDEINSYFKVVQAYKSGGYNTRDPHQNADSNGNDFGFGFEEGFNEEKVLSYEWGLKSELLDRRMRLNTNVFYTEYEDIQLNFLLPGTVADTKVANAGTAEMSGFEMDLTFLALENLMLMFNYAYLTAEITEAENPATGEDISEQYVFGSAPRHSYTAVANWTIMQADWGLPNLNVSYNYMGERNGGILREGVKNLKLNDYYLWNARLGIDNIPAGDGNVHIALWGKNLLDREYELTTVDNLPHADRATIWGEPRSYGVDISYEF